MLKGAPLELTDEPLIWAVFKLHRLCEFTMRIISEIVQHTDCLQCRHRSFNKRFTRWKGSVNVPVTIRVFLWFFLHFSRQEVPTTLKDSRPPFGFNWNGRLRNSLNVFKRKQKRKSISVLTSNLEVRRPIKLIVLMPPGMSFAFAQDAVWWYLSERDSLSAQFAS